MFFVSQMSGREQYSLGQESGGEWTEDEPIRWALLYISVSSLALLVG